MDKTATTFDGRKPTDLLVVGTPTVSEQRVCISWTTPGMLQVLTRVAGRHLALVLDGKHRVFDSRYSILSVGILQRRPHATTTTLLRTRGARTQTRSFTMTMWPLLQAMIDVESAENVNQALQTLSTISAEHYHVDLKQHVLQVHKDYALGLEQSRLQIFPQSRPMNDFAHLIRFVQTSTTWKMPTQRVRRHGREHATDYAFSANDPTLP